MRFLQYFLCNLDDFLIYKMEKLFGRHPFWSSKVVKKDSPGAPPGSRFGAKSGLFHALIFIRFFFVF